tara:strand:+ start:413 stop:784 length:372 start_codon:yes stop_codon:yes gene_type:complete
MGLNINVYKEVRNGNDSFTRWLDNVDCTNGGITSKNIKGLCITNCDGPFEPCEDYPAAQLVSRNFGGGKIVHIVPTAEIEKGSWTMMGGNYGSTSDSRFSEKVEEMLGARFYGALAIHDRVEY